MEPNKYVKEKKKSIFDLVSLKLGIKKWVQKENYLELIEIFEI